ncbi:TraM recognition domain-containing protein [Pseudonocardia sp. GCM10023141]|uniref:TraM recognition domain-containing protein n=1 Tax=Pseudonocardia sp. GCM10023141 TaxID=3252653 RepID=UPI003624652D
MSGSTLLVFAVSAGITVLLWKRRARGMAFGAGLFTLLPAGTLLQQTPWWMYVLLAGPAVVWVRHRRARTASTVTRWGARSRRNSGVATSGDIWKVGSAVALRRQAATVRPSLSTTSRVARYRQLLALPASEIGVALCKVGVLKVWASCEDVVLGFGGPRVGKSQWLAGRILDAPGAVLTTSTRIDLLTQTGPMRAQTGPVYVFNPVGLAELPSSITFDPLTGCCDPVTAAERAADMIAASSNGGSEEREFWNDQGRRNLAALMHAAALGGRTMADVQKWLADLQGCQREVTSLLRNHSPEPASVEVITQFIETNDRTRTSITSTIMPALGWLTQRPAREAASGATPFDVEALLASKATVYLLGGEESQVSPLVCALTGYIAREARRIALLTPGGRLDPPLTLALDEAALICPVPLHRWTADMGGRGVTIIALFQSRAQLLSRYGSDDAAVILNNAGARIVFGAGDRDDLDYWSTLAGDRDEPIVTTDTHGHVTSRTVRKVPVLSASQLANLNGRVVVFRRRMAPVVGKAEQAWQRRDVRAHHTPNALSIRVPAAIARHTRSGLAWTRQRAQAVPVLWAALRSRLRILGNDQAPIERTAQTRPAITAAPVKPARDSATVTVMPAPSWLRPDAQWQPLDAGPAEQTANGLPNGHSNGHDGSNGHGPAEPGRWT